MRTLQDMLNEGYALADTAWERGYVSRKADANKQEVKVAGGKRKGEFYVLLPSWQSTQFCIRQYIKRVV